MIFSFRATSRRDIDFIKHVYSKPYCRIQPYLVGMVLGYMTFKNLGRKIGLRWVSLLD